jgi:HlyD family secretion protein
MADAVTEETLAKVVFETPPAPLPPLGELAEVTLPCPSLPPCRCCRTPPCAVRGETGRLEGRRWQYASPR